MLDQKLNLYIVRTVAHIHRVQKNMVFLTTICRKTLGLSSDDCRELLYNVMRHDRSKFSEKQFDPYIELTYYYHSRKYGDPTYEYPDGIGDLVGVAVTDHYCVENHHPEGLNKDRPKFSRFDAFETVCDLQAMAQEFNEGNCRKYFESFWKPKQVENFIYPDNFNEVLGWMEEAIKCFELNE